MHIIVILLLCIKLVSFSYIISKLLFCLYFSVNMAKRSASAIWEYFTMFQDRVKIAKCNICSQKIRREPPGATSKNISTKSLWSI